MTEARLGICHLVLCAVLASADIGLAQNPVTNQPDFQLRFVSNSPIEMRPPASVPPASSLRTSTPGKYMDNRPVKPAPTNDPNTVIPLLRFSDVPLTTAIENLARLGEVNYLIDPDLEDRWKNAGEPVVNLRWEKLTAVQALQRLLERHGLVLIEDPASNIAYIVRASQRKHLIFAGSADGETPPQTTSTNGDIPQIVFADVPLSIAIENLARLEKINYLIDRDVSDSWSTDGDHLSLEPWLSLRFNRVKARSALTRILNIRGLDLRDDPTTGVALVIRSDKLLPKVDASLLGVNGIAVYHSVNNIKISDTPLKALLEELVRQIALPVRIDPAVKSVAVTRNGLPLKISINWEGVAPHQAIVALCKAYGLRIVKDAATGEIWIKPGQNRRHH